MKVKKEGAYIIEINHHKGYAVANTPLYVGEGYPVLPDFEDMTPEIVNIGEINKHTLLLWRRDGNIFWT